MLDGNILIVAVDGLRGSSLGAYGNTLAPTPALDRFAADCFLLDACLTAAPELPAVYRALWQSLHPLRSDSYVQQQALPPAMPQVLADRGYQTTLITDEPVLLSLPSTAAFYECLQVTGAADNRASAASQTSLAQLFATVCDAVETGSGPRRLIWVHARGMYGPWDAPLELQQSLLDEGDPPPVEAIDPPDLILSSVDDPDTAFRYSCAYAAQVAVLDACWEGLMETLGDSPRADDWLVMLLGSRGFPLGEHRRIGGVDQRLYADQLHVPWLLRFPGGTGRLARTSQLASSLDCLPTLLDWITEGSEIDRMTNRRDGRSLLPLAKQIQPTDRDVLVFASADGDRAIRTQGWSLRRAADADGENSAAAAEVARSCDRFAGRKAEYELFVRPDDRWEANDVATLCPDVVEGLARVLHDTTEKIVRGEPLPNESLPKDLTTRE